jgi:hypothetical protein
MLVVLKAEETTTEAEAAPATPETPVETPEVIEEPAQTCDAAPVEGETPAEAPAAH